MKVLLATYWAVPHVGGVWTYMVQLKDKLESLGHEVDLLGYGHDNSYVYKVNEARKVEKGHLSSILTANAENFTNHPNPLVHYTESQRNFYEEAAIFLGLGKYDVIHTQDVISTASMNRIRPAHSALVATLHGCLAHEIMQQLTTIHNTPTSYMAKAYFDELEYIGAATSEYTIVMNKELKDILTKEFNVPEEQLKLFNYGFDSESFIKQMKKPFIHRPSNKKVIIYSGSLKELGEVQFLLSSLVKLKEMRTDWVCWIVGKGEKQAELKVQSNILGLEENIIFHGKRNDVSYLVSISDIIVFPCLLRNKQQSVIEAQIFGRAMIICDAGCESELVKHGVTGIVSPTGDSGILCKNINLLLDNEKYREFLGSNAKKIGMTHWLPKAAVKKVLKVYQCAISKRREEESNE